MTAQMGRMMKENMDRFFQKVYFSDRAYAEFGHLYDQATVEFLEKVSEAYASYSRVSSEIEVELHTAYLKVIVQESSSMRAQALQALISSGGDVGKFIHQYYTTRTRNIQHFARAQSLKVVSEELDLRLADDDTPLTPELSAEEQGYYRAKYALFYGKHMRKWAPPPVASSGTQLKV